MKEYKIQLSQSEFIKNYYKGNKEREKRFNELGEFAMPCDCGVDGCEGWAMVSRDSILTHIELYMNKEGMMNGIGLRYNPND